MGLHRAYARVAHSLGLQPVVIFGPKHLDPCLLTVPGVSRLYVKKPYIGGCIGEKSDRRFVHISRLQCPHFPQNTVGSKNETPCPSWTGSTTCLLGRVQRQICSIIPLRSQVSKSKRESSGKTSKAIAEAKDKPFAELTVGQKVKQAGKDVTYTGIIIFGVGVTGIMFYAIGRELFSGQSPSGVYGRAFKICKKNEDIVIALGEPIKGYGEMTRRGRRRHVSHQEYDVGGVRHIRMKFYMEGPMNKGTVHLDAKQNEKGKYEFRYIFVELENYPHKTIVIEDNR